MTGSALSLGLREIPGLERHKRVVGREAPAQGEVVGSLVGGGRAVRPRRCQQEFRAGMLRVWEKESADELKALGPRQGEAGPLSEPPRLRSTEPLSGTPQAQNSLQAGQSSTG